MKFRVFDEHGVDITDECSFMISSAGRLCEEDFIGQYSAVDPDSYTVRLEPDYRVCGNCNWFGDERTATRAHECLKPESPFMWCKKGDKPCEHWAFCGVTE